MLEEENAFLTFAWVIQVKNKNNLLTDCENNVTSTSSRDQRTDASSTTRYLEEGTLIRGGFSAVSQSDHSSVTPNSTACKDLEYSSFITGCKSPSTIASVPRSNEIARGIVGRKSGLSNVHSIAVLKILNASFLSKLPSNLESTRFSST